MIKARQIFFLLGSVIIGLLFISLIIVWSINLQKPNTLLIQSPELNQSAKFISNEAALSLHLKVNPNEITNYSEAFAKDKTRKRAKQITEKLINSSFALAGIDFNKEISKWIGEELSFAILEDGKNYEWLISLTSKDPTATKEFLESYWQKQSLSGFYPEAIDYKGVGIISNKEAKEAKYTKKGMSTSLVNSDTLLISSTKEILKNALDVSQYPDKNQYENINLVTLVNNLNKGIALITVAPKKLHPWFNLPYSETNNSSVNNFVGALYPEEKSIVLEGVFEFKDPLKSSNSNSIGINSFRNSLISLNGSEKSLAIVNNASSILNPITQDPLLSLIRPLLTQELSDPKRLTPKLIYQEEEGDLIWMQGSNGWSILTNTSTTDMGKIDNVLREQGLLNSSIRSNGEEFKVWSKLIEKEKDKKSLFTNEVKAILQINEGQNFWGETLMAIEDLKQYKDLMLKNNQLENISPAKEKYYSQLIYLGEENSKNRLKKWYPWQLAQTLVGGTLDSSIKGLSVAIGLDNSINDHYLFVNGKLNLG